MWFAWKFVLLWYQQQPLMQCVRLIYVVICLKIRTFVVSATTSFNVLSSWALLWFAWKFVPLWYQQQLHIHWIVKLSCCDLLENSYLCGISNNVSVGNSQLTDVVICLKIRTFVVSATTDDIKGIAKTLLWFAWKFVPLWYQQQLTPRRIRGSTRCDLLENSYLCGISNNRERLWNITKHVVICLKIRTFVVSATTQTLSRLTKFLLWFAWKFVPLWYQQQLLVLVYQIAACCDLLENSYLCGISNNYTGEAVG